MECFLSCQVCNKHFDKLIYLKKHVRSPEHRQKMKDIFPEAKISTTVFVPHIVFVDPQSKTLFTQPVVGLSLTTLCFVHSECFYLCHVCERSCQQADIIGHIFSREHCVNYFNYTNPNELSFSWIPRLDLKRKLWPKLKEEGNKKNLQKLQILHLPRELVDKLRSKTYSEVMQTLSENEKLFNLFEALQPKRKTIQEYQHDSQRKHLLLGMQHVVECICVGPGEKRHYLCTLCSLTVAKPMIISHILSFDHIYCYFVSYKEQVLIDVDLVGEERQRAENSALHPSTLMSKASYQDYNSFIPNILDFAKQSEQIHRTENVSMKKVSLQPDQFKSVTSSCYAEALKKLETIMKTSLTTSIKPGNKLILQCSAAVSQPSLSSRNINCQIRCQDCNYIFDGICPYLQHLSRNHHKKMMIKFFQEAGREDSFEQQGRFHLGLYTYVQDSLKKNQPAVGTDLVVACICSVVGAEPIYLCFACVECFAQPSVEMHFESRKHLVNTMLYQNPWKLPFAWEDDLDNSELRSTAWEDEEEGRGNMIILKILDFPVSIFQTLISCNYKQVLRNLQLYHTLLRREVPPCKTFSKLQENDRFPLLGKQFLVMHDLIFRRKDLVVGSLCLLCQRRLWTDEAPAHVFSWEHVTAFLDRFHPGSFNPDTDSKETLLDLAKQAARIHSVSNAQEIKLENPIWNPCTYKTAISILACAKRREGKGSLEPPIKPRMKLVPRKTTKDLDKKDSPKKCTNTDKQENKQIKEERCAEETPTIKRKASEDFHPEEMHKPDETGQLIRVKTEESSTEREIEKDTENCKNIERNKETKTEGDGSLSIKRETSPLSDFQLKNKKKRPNRTPDKSLKEACPHENVGQETTPKRPRLASTDNPHPEEGVKIPKIKIKEEKDDTMEVKNDRKVMTEGLKRVSSSFIECHCVQRAPVFLCGSCSLKISDTDVIRHLTEIKHQKMRQVVVSLDEKTYSIISKQSFQSVIQILQAQKLWPDINCNRSSASSQSCGSANVASATQNQHEDKREVQDMEMSSDLDESATAPDLSAKTKTTCKTSQVKVPKSNSSVVGLTDPSPPTVTANRTNLSLKGSENVGKANISPDTTVKLTEVDAAFKMGEMAEPATSKPATSSSKRAASEIAARVSCRTPSSSQGENGLKYYEGTSKTPAVADAMVVKPPIKHSNADASWKTAFSHVKKSVAEKADVETVAHKRSPPSAPHLNTTMTAISEHKSPSKEPPPVLTSIKPSGNLKVGTNQLIVVSCEEKKQIYCLLCSVKLKSSSQCHLTKPEHHLNYVMMKYPEWTAKDSEFERKLNHTVALLAKIEKDLPHARNAQFLEVKEEEYLELRNLSNKTAVEKVKAMVRQKELQVSLCSVADSTGVLRNEVSSSCEVSSSDDGLQASHETSGFSANNQPDMSRDQRQRGPTQMSYMESSIKEDSNLAAGHLISDQSSAEEDMEVDDVNQDQLRSLSWSHPEPVESDMADSVQLEQPEPDADRRRSTEITSLTERSEMESESGAALSPRRTSLDGDVIDLIQDRLQSSGCYSKIHPHPGLRTRSEHITGVVKKLKPLTPDVPCRERVSATQCPQTAQESPQNLSAVRICSPHLRTAASVAPGRQKLSGPNHGTQQAPKHGTRPGAPSASQAQLKTSVGGRAQGSSNLSYYLKACRLDTKLVVGMACVWECQGNSLSTFYLCETCEEILSRRDICPHMVSLDHQLKYLRSKHPKFLQMFWKKEDLPPEFQKEILNDIIQELTKRERVHQVDAQCLLLGPELHEFVRTAPFSEALKIVTNIKNEEKPSVFRLPISPSQQNSQQGETESLPTEILSAQTPEENRRSRSEAVKKTEDSSLEKKPRLGGRGVSSLEMNPTCSKAGAGPYVSIVDTCLNSQESSSDLCFQPTFTPNMSVLQSSDPQPQVKWKSESAFSTTISSTSGENPEVSLRGEVPPVRKTLLRSPTSGPLEIPLPVKHTPNPVTVGTETKSQPTSKSTSIIPAENPTPLVLKDEDSEPKKTKTTVDRMLFEEMFSMMKKRNFKINPSPVVSASDDTETSSSSVGFEGREDLKSVKMENQLVKYPMKKNPLSNSVDEIETAASVDLESVSSANISSEQFVKENLQANMSEYKVVNYAAPAADLSDKQTWQTIGAQDVFRNENRAAASCAATNQTPEWNREPDGAEISQLPINTIITPRTNPVKHTLQASKDKQAQTDVSTDQLVRFRSDPPQNLVDSAPVPGAFYAPHSQTTHFIDGESAFIYSQAVAGYSSQSASTFSAASSSQQFVYHPDLSPPAQTGNPFSLRSFGYSLAAPMPPGWEHVGLQQLQYNYFLWK